MEHLKGKRHMIRALLLASIFLLLAGCQITHSKEVVNKVPKSPESTMAVKDLSSGNEELVRYTTSGNIFSSGINNIDLSIEALYNRNTKKYVYLMKLRDLDPIHSDNKDAPNQYKILRITAGVKSDITTGQYIISASSPLFREGVDYKLEGTYLLFTSKQKFTGEQFMVESFLTNKETIGENETGVLTYRAYFESGKSSSYH
ncbi:hypothetical protein [Metabacillus sp. FJAT-52054]|uniref:Lipoprotein n=1 Tax=Metabacillus sediminis TaxID=3117746 RepID=A0ABZ2NLX9_9BACI